MELLEYRSQRMQKAGEKQKQQNGQGLYKTDHDDNTQVRYSNDLSGFGIGTQQSDRG